MTTPVDHDAYIAAAPGTFRPSLTRLRTILSRVLPEADEIVAYDMPGFSIGGSVVASYAAFSRQCGLYLLPEAVAEHADEIAASGLRSTRTGITFTPSRPIPDDLVERLVRSSRDAAAA
ncbi:iron chaperone [Cellulosimicrobium sp. NPDC057862]|uniref:iron chaperone n=1 Tax=Cellulosimicrobium sp. NPDC057862 TaxID=3346266 RepID=UPI0036705F85